MSSVKRKIIYELGEIDKHGRICAECVRLAMICRGRESKWMRLRHRRRPEVQRDDPPSRGFTPYQCVQLFWLSSQGVRQIDLARGLECNQGTISRAIRRGRDTFHQWDAPRMLVVGSDWSCGHDRPIQVGERIVCLKCFVSGYDETDGMKVTASDLATIEREVFESTLPKDSEGKPIYPQEPLKPFAERMHGGEKKKAKPKRKVMNEIEKALRAHAAARGLTPAQIEAFIQAILPLVLQIIALFGGGATPPAPTS